MMVSKPFPKLSRAEASAQRKAAQAAIHAAAEAAKAEKLALRELERAAEKQAARELAERTRNEARARAQQLTTVAIVDIPKTQGEVRQIAKALTPRMLELLVEIAEDPMQQASGRVAAINAIIDRGHGKPVQPMTELPGAVLTDMDDEKLERYILNEAKRFIDGKVVEHVRIHAEHAEAADDGTEAGGGAATDRQLQDRSGRPDGGRKRPRGAGKG
jgi:hypothetical protein